MIDVRNSSSEAPRPGFFERKDPWGQGLAIWVFATLIFLAPVAVDSLRSIRLDNNVAAWLPADDPSALEYAWCRQNFPAQDSLYLTWDGSTLDDPRLPILIGELNGQIDEDGVRRGGIPYVSSVLHAGEILARMTEMGVDLQDGINRLEGSAVGRGSIKVALTDAGREQSDEFIQKIVSESRKRFGITLQAQPPLVTWQPAEEQVASFENQQTRFANQQAVSTPQTADLVSAHDFQLSWKGMGQEQKTQDRLISWIKSQTAASGSPLVEDCFISAASPIAVLITLSEAGVAETSKTIEAIKQAAARALIPRDSVVLGGSIVSASELNNAVLRAAWNPNSSSILNRSVMLLSGLVGIAFAFYSLRSWRLGAVVVGASYYAALLGMAVVPLTGGNMNMVLVVMPTLLMVLCLSGAIHIANYWRHAAWEDPKTAVQRAVKMAYEPCLLAAFTTALGLISLAGSPLAPVRDFGIYASVGTIISVIMILYGLPSLLQIIPQTPGTASPSEDRFWVRYGKFVCRNARPTLAASIGCCLLCSIGLQYFKIETKVIRYFPEQSQVVKDFKWMEDSLTGTCPVEIIVRFDADAQKATRFLDRLEVVRKVGERVRSHAEVSGALSLADFLPERAAPDETAGPREKIIYNRRSHETEERAKSGAAAGARELVTMSSTTPHPTDAQRRAPDELWRINAQCSIVSDADFGILTRELNEYVSEALAGQAGVDHYVTGTVPLFLQTQRAVLESLIWSFLMAFGMITVVMMWLLKDLLAGAISMLPNILPVLMVFGLVSWAGQRVDIGTMVTASIALGIAVDGTLHLLIWFQDGLKKGMNREQAVISSLSHCGPAMWQTSAAVGMGLLVLYPAELLLISRFGWLMAALIGMALLGDIVLLPTLLVGKLGKLIEARLKSRGLIQSPDPVVPAPTHIPTPHFGHTRSLQEKPRYVG